MRDRLLVLVLAAIAVADLSQPLLLAWRPKHAAALAGAALYAACAVLVARGWRPAAFVVAAMPLVPLSVLTLRAAGADLPVQPDAAMLGVLALQLVAAGLAVARIRAESSG